MRVGSLSQEDSVGQDSLEEEIATHLSILAWRIPWTRETWRAIVNKELDRTEQAPAHTHTHTHAPHCGFQITACQMRLVLKQQIMALAVGFMNSRNTC